MGSDADLNDQRSEDAASSVLAQSLVDLHAHTLPAVDDGPRTLDDALLMLKAAAADGVKTIVATPHAHHCHVAEIPDRVHNLNEAARAAGIDVIVLPGSEVRIAPDLVERFQDGVLVTLNHSRYILLELYLYHAWALHVIEKVIGKLLDAGIRPILAHPERYPYLRDEQKFLDDLVQAGTLLQINAPSLTGYHGNDARRTAERLLQQRLVHIIASDAHNHHRRAPILRYAFESAVELASLAYAEWMINQAESVIADEPTTAPPARPLR